MSNFVNSLKGIFAPRPLTWQQQLALCLIHKDYILGTPSLYKAKFPMATIKCGYVRVPKTNSYHCQLSIGQLLETWENIPVTVIPCPHCGKPMYFFRLIAQGLTIYQASFVCPSCGAINEVHASGAIDLAKAIYAIQDPYPEQEYVSGFIGLIKDIAKLPEGTQPEIPIRPLAIPFQPQVKYEFYN